MSLTNIRTCKIGNHQNHKATKFVAKNLLIFAIALTLFIPSSTFALVTDITAIDDVTSGGDFLLGDPRGVATFIVDDTPYAIVGASFNDAVQIINLSDPTAITAEDNATDGNDGFDVLDAAFDVDTFIVNDILYAIVVSVNNNGVQIINLSNPANITAEDNLLTGGGVLLSGPRDVETFIVNDIVYAIVVSTLSNAVQIINLSNPGNITAEDNLANGVGVLLNGPREVAIFTVDDTPYAIVASVNVDTVQIINLSDPTAITAEDNATHGNEGFLLDGAVGVDTFTVNGVPYAIVVSSTGGTVQIINLSDPENITAVDNATDDIDGFDELAGAFGVKTFESDDTYAIVASSGDDGIQIIDLSVPTAITAVDDATDGFDGFEELLGATDVDIFTVNSTVYAIVASSGDSGVQIIELGPESIPTLESTFPETPSATPSSLNSAF